MFPVPGLYAPCLATPWLRLLPYWVRCPCERKTVGLLTPARSYSAGCALLVASNPQGFPSGIFSTSTLPDNSTLSLYLDLQTFSSAQSTCQSNGTAYGTLASVHDQEEWTALSELVTRFWNSSVAQSYLSAPASYGLGFVNASLFRGCAWLGACASSECCSTWSHAKQNHCSAFWLLHGRGAGLPPSQFRFPPTAGLTNMNADTSLAEENSLQSVSFIDGVQLSSYVSNVRLTHPVFTTGWSLYGKKDLYATCAMLCPVPTAQQTQLGYTQVGVRLWAQARS